MLLGKPLGGRVKRVALEFAEGLRTAGFCESSEPSVMVEQPMAYRGELLFFFCYCGRVRIAVRWVNCSHRECAFAQIPSIIIGALVVEAMDNRGR